jgi:hypothetical protein
MENRPKNTFLIKAPMDDFSIIMQIVVSVGAVSGQKHR